MKNDNFWSCVILAVAVGVMYYGHFIMPPSSEKLAQQHQEYVAKKAQYSKEYIDAINEKGFDFETANLKDLGINTYVSKTGYKSYSCPLETNMGCDVVRTSDNEILIYELNHHGKGGVSQRLLFKFKKDASGKLRAETVEY